MSLPPPPHLPPAPPLRDRRRARSAPCTPTRNLSPDSVVIVDGNDVFTWHIVSTPMSPEPQPCEITETTKSPEVRLISFDKIVYSPTPDLTRVRRRRVPLEALPSPLSTPIPIKYQNPPRTGAPNPNYVLVDGIFLTKELVEARKAWSMGTDGS